MDIVYRPRTRYGEADGREKNTSPYVQQVTEIAPTAARELNCGFLLRRFINC